VEGETRQEAESGTMGQGRPVVWEHGLPAMRPMEGEAFGSFLLEAQGPGSWIFKHILNIYRPGWRFRPYAGLLFSDKKK
jgi:hypothetical protein